MLETLFAGCRFLRKKVSINILLLSLLFRFDVGQDEIDAFLKEVDIVNAWLDGCKELTTSRPSPGDEKALQGSLRIVKVGLLE